MSSHHWATLADILAKHSGLAPANARGATHPCVCLFDCDAVVTRRPAEVGGVIAEWDWLAHGLATATEAPTRPFSNWVSTGNLDALWRYNETSNGDLDFYQHPRHPLHFHHPLPQPASSCLNVAHLWFHFHLHWVFFPCLFLAWFLVVFFLTLTG